MRSELPLFSIIIPTYNRPHQLSWCLQAIEGLAYPHDRFEVIVVDDGSHTPLDSIVEKVSESISVKLIRQGNTGPAQARNRGAAEAQGRYLAFTDDDCAISANWLTALANVLRDEPDCAVGGKTLNCLLDNPFSMGSQLLLDYLYEYYNHEFGRATFLASNNVAFPRAAFLEVGGFDGRFGQAAAEDRELCDRWISQGRRMCYAPEALISHAHVLSFGTLWRQHFNYGRGAFHFHHIKAQRGCGVVKTEPLSFYFKMVTYPYKHVPFTRATPISFLMLLTQAANATGYFIEKYQH